jgi:hypothetical protein
MTPPSYDEGLAQALFDCMRIASRRVCMLIVLNVKQIVVAGHLADPPGIIRWCMC